LTMFTRGLDLQNLLAEAKVWSAFLFRFYVIFIANWARLEFDLK
jgi:hypothetical protein